MKVFGPGTRMNWKYAFGEVLLIVVGVSIALAASSWYENRQLRGVEISALAQLQATLREDLDRITGRYDTIGRVNQGIASFVDHIETGNLKQAESNLQKSCDIARENQNDVYEARGHNELGRLLAYMGQYDKADKGLEKASGLAAVSPLGKLATIWGQIKSYE